MTKVSSIAGEMLILARNPCYRVEMEQAITIAIILAEPDVPCDRAYERAVRVYDNFLRGESTVLDQYRGEAGRTRSARLLLIEEKGKNILLRVGCAPFRNFFAHVACRSSKAHARAEKAVQSYLAHNPRVASAQLRKVREAIDSMK